MPVTAEDASATPRASARESMLLVATLRAAADPGQPAIPLRVRNLSAGGLMGECDRRMNPGETVTVALRGAGDVGGAIAWVAGNRFGMRFDRAIDPKASRKPVGQGMQTSQIRVASDTRRPAIR